MLKGEELKRYSRQVILPEIGITGQEKLKNAKVLMIGAGGLGCPVLQYLTAAGVGEIGIVDDDVVDISNLHRQILYGVNDVGGLKAALAKEKLEKLNPHVFITAYPVRFTSANAEDICAPYDLVIDGSDNFGTRYLVNDTCVALKKPLVFGSIFKFEGHVSVFNYQDGPDYRDVFPEAPPADEVPNCAEIGVMGILPGIIGTYMANEAIKIICGIGETLSGKLMTMNALDNTTGIFKIGKQQNEVKAADIIPISTIPDEITMDQLNNWLSESADEIYLIDVRESYEFEDYNIGGINVPLYELKDRIEELPTDKKLIFYCQTGQRSKMAIQLLKPLYKGVMYNLKNGVI
ncbi:MULTISPECIES: HesA/MoeB/ThiF family protein [unclassified Mucilaginibacter]|uniref:HesA/MoeB/ThiF family protein n=1 Tax=unclassified Mucilaginibacter TaxID=2617802 RepID=UPI002AC95335|nr:MULTISPECIES: HesA/MoeB/ThiF family protein [unclassified Mucilaginibacter]MEB0261976.1 HesA/MoeB/ThiF family protein [Mucilaginibacter sp. 10I4]MEB0277276.1 HesA/MoeB/ThiF family protein [Mucilaginibacter sp. 10B2]MEB0300860.1 HesA/MoeB/ThiF family protein [Mucilaginibacter sp. 5C4]WPX25402.1 HesA/MoeB/ThiF family protein [Mucilaginibacter sp. 5C4]